MRTHTIFTVAPDGITSEDVDDAELIDRVRTAPEGTWHRAGEWPILFVPPDAAAADEEGGGEGEAAESDDGADGPTLIVPFEDPAEFRLLLQNEGLEDVVAVGDLDMTLLERIEEEMA